MTSPRVPVHSFDEWSRLREVIVGAADGFKRIHVDTSFGLFYIEYYDEITQHRRPDNMIQIPPIVLEELLEDIEDLVLALQTAGVRVMRPVRNTNQTAVTTPLWSSLTTPALNIRDNAIILGSAIVETSPHLRSRLFETDLLKPVFYDYYNMGAGWLSMPRPTLGRGSLDPGYYSRSGFDTDAVVGQDEAQSLLDLSHELVLDGAQCVRLGYDVLVNVANRNHELGFLWLQRVFGEQFRFHRLNAITDNHIDSIVLPLRPGLLLLRSPSYLALLPKQLHQWDIIYPPEPRKARFPVYGPDLCFLASKYIDMNVLSVDEQTVVVNSLYPELVRLLERRGFSVIPVRHRHRRLFSGGFHCFTLDCVRDGEATSYL